MNNKETINITDKVILYTVYAAVLIMMVLSIIFGVIRYDNKVEERKVIAAVERKTEDPGLFVMSVDKSYTNLKDKTVYTVIMLDNDEDVNLYYVVVQGKVYDVYCMGAIG